MGIIIKSGLALCVGLPFMWEFFLPKAATYYLRWIVKIAKGDAITIGVALYLSFRMCGTQLVTLFVMCSSVLSPQIRR